MKTQPKTETCYEKKNAKITKDMFPGVKYCAAFFLSLAPVL